MNGRTRLPWTSLAALLVGVSVAFAGGAGERPAGEPPFGVAVQSDAQGTKLSGIGYLEVYNIGVRGGTTVDVRAYVRLRQGSRLDTAFADDIPGDLAQISATQAAIVAHLKEEILRKFFDNDQSLEITVKGLEEYIVREASFGSTPTQLALFDVVFAVK